MRGWRRALGAAAVVIVAIYCAGEAFSYQVNRSIFTQRVWAHVQEHRRAYDAYPERVDERGFRGAELFYARVGDRFVLADPGLGPRPSDADVREWLAATEKTDNCFEIWAATVFTDRGRVRSCFK